MFDFTLGAHSPDDIAHIIQVSLAPAFILAGLAQMLNVFSARLARIADKVNTTAKELNQAGAAEAHYLSQQLSYLRRRSFVLDAAVVCVCLGAGLILSSILTLFVGALRDTAAASVLFACFGAGLLFTICGLGAFLTEILMAGRGIRVEVDRQQDQALVAERG
ncbi:DUF2721 domain-containing protein [Methylobacterium sp. J-070]|uniref:DUF2721 domain-containing protein n=1 Tax=Methylobacterium sp. J-070 TaxID=2836650 RepID=UPI001FB9CE7D|nr:DUF2721 domain-containing protein [Methylobacterium sp. J-070]MCJ2052798.1 DUF2721 domain-containing protein [Methylobacterium sp. J-070]